MTFLKDMVLLGGTAMDSMKQLFQVLGVCRIKTESRWINSLSTRQNQTEFYTLEQIEYSSKPHMVSHLKAIKVSSISN